MAGITLSPNAAMSMAMTQARQGLGFVSPNPPVGCVILDSGGRLLSTGYHKKIGDAHAEINALSMIADKSRLQGATVYVTLEPCAHHGKTPPCAEYLATLPIAKVVYGLMDPNPKVSGMGIAILNQAGILTESIAELNGELEDLAEIFLKNQREKKAFVAVKVATTADGQMSEKNNRQSWISGDQARQHVQTLRGYFDSVLVGRRTLEIDNPFLNSRDPQFRDKTNRVLILDSQGRSSGGFENRNVAKVRSRNDVIFCTLETTDIDEKVNAWRIPSIDSELDWRALATRAYSEGICSILVEGGAKTIASALRQNAVDRWYQFICPSLMGSHNAISVTGDWSRDSLENRLKLTRPTWQTFGQDVLLSGRLGI